MAKFDLDKSILKWWEQRIGQEHLLEFEWDSGNSLKNEKKHGVFQSEIEAVFKDKNLMILGKQYQPPVEGEERFGCFGFSGDNILFVVFTIKKDIIRPIHARKAGKKERELYENKK